MSRKKFAKDITVIGFINLLTALRGIIILPTITKLLGADNYGIWSQFMVTISLVAPVATLCLPYTLVRFLAGEKDEKQIQDGFYSVIAVVLGTVLLVTLLLFAFATPFSSFIGVETRLVKILALIIFLECFNSVFLGLFRAFQEVGKFSFFTLMLVFGDAGLILATSFMGLGLLGAISSLLAVRLAVFLLAGLLIVKKIGFVFPKFLRLKEYLHFGLPGLPSTIFLWIVQSSNRYLIGFFLGAAFVGYYAPADLLASTIISFFIGPFSFLLPAVLSKLFEENKIDEIRTYLRYSLKYFLMIGIPCVFGISILSNQILTIISTTEIASHSYIVVPIVASGIILYGVYAIIAQIIVLYKKTLVEAAIWGVAAGINVIANITLIPRYGIFGGAISTLITYVFALLAATGYCSRYFRFAIDWLFIIKSGFAASVMTIFVLYLKPIGLWHMIVAAAAGALIYFVILFILRSFDKKELSFLKSFLSKRE